MDEPSMGLAPVLVNEIFNIIAGLHADGGTIFLVEQNARKALRVSKRATSWRPGGSSFRRLQ